MPPLLVSQLLTCSIQFVSPPCRHAAAGSGEVAGGTRALLHQLLGLCGLLRSACEAAQGAQQSLRQMAFNEVTQAETAGPGWLASEGPRAAWSELAEVRQLISSY